MRGLTLTQPYATLAAIEAKRIETRSWRTAYRGPLAIHAGAGLGPVGGRWGLQVLCCAEPFQTALRGTARAHLLDPSFFANNLPRGAIVAVATLVGCVVMDPSITSPAFWGWADIPGAWELTDQERAFGDYAPGRYAWLLADVRRLPAPVPCRGALGLWALSADALAAVEAQL